MTHRSGFTPLKRSGTALSQYQRLEAVGYWRESPDAPPREVIVRMGEATLVLADPRTEGALSHWSLPAVARLNPESAPPLFAPAEDSPESVEITDEDMLAALKTVERAVHVSRPHPGRLRGWLLGGGAALIALFAVFAAPGALIRHTAAAVPMPKQAEIGQYALDDLTQLTGAACQGEFGLPALAALAERLFGPENTPILYILPKGLTRAAHLPGNQIVLAQALLEAEGPEALAAAALIESEVAKSHAPLEDALSYAGLRASFGLLTSGELPAKALAGYGAALLATQAALPSESHLTLSFAAAKLSPSPYAEWLEASEGGQDAAAALRKVAASGAITPAPLLSDDAWLALQSVCQK